MHIAGGNDANAPVFPAQREADVEEPPLVRLA
jgi:hypothetical protein